MDLVLWGGTGQAKVLRELLEPQGVRVVAVFDNSEDVPAPFPDVPLGYGATGFNSWLATRTGELPRCLVAIGGDRGRDRCELQRWMAGRGLLPHVAIHRTAFVASTAEVAAGSQVLAQAAVCAAARLGEACIVNTAASVDHECVLADGVHICPGARLAGCVEVGEYAMIGTGAIVLPRVRIGARAIVGAGAVVREDVLDDSVVVGNPARVIRNRRH